MEVRCKEYFYVIPDWKDVNIQDLYHVKHSEIVINATLEFAQTMSSARPVIGVHIRAERIHKTGGNITRCLGELNNFLRCGSITNATDNDLAEYGTAHNCSDVRLTPKSKLELTYNITVCVTASYNYRGGHGLAIHLADHYFSLNMR